EIVCQRYRIARSAIGWPVLRMPGSFGVPNRSSRRATMKTGATFATLIVAAVLLAGPTSGALAEESTGNPIMLREHSMRMSKLNGSYVYDDQGQTVGSVAEILMKRGSEPMAILSVGDYVGGGPKMVAVPLSRINLEGPKPTMAGATKEKLANMPVY